MPATSEQFLERLMALRSPSQQARYERAFKPDESDEFVGVRMGDVFKLSKEFADLPLGEIEKDGWFVRFAAGRRRCVGVCNAKAV